MPDRYYRRTPYIPAKDPLTAIPPSRHPFQFWAMLACAVTGGGNLVHAHSSISHMLPGVTMMLWATIMLFGGVLAIAGAFLRDRLSGLLLERFALGAITIGAAVYSVAIFSVVGLAGLAPETLSFGVAVAAGWRIVHVTRELAILKKMITWINR